jgi:hypothetical protein
MLSFFHTYHAVIMLAVFYAFQAAVLSLPDEDFKFYPWMLKTLRLLVNAVPPRYNIPVREEPKNLSTEGKDKI